MSFFAFIYQQYLSFIKHINIEGRKLSGNVTLILYIAESPNKEEKLPNIV